MFSGASSGLRQGRIAFFSSAPSDAHAACVVPSVSVVAPVAAAVGKTQFHAAISCGIGTGYRTCFSKTLHLRFDRDRSAEEELRACKNFERAAKGQAKVQAFASAAVLPHSPISNSMKGVSVSTSNIAG
jgi:hypothetical protein